MKIKGFGELILEEVRKLYVKIKEETNDYLVYLKDSGIEVTTSDNLRYIDVHINKDYNELVWSDIKDDLIQYLKIMSKNYYIQFIEVQNYRLSDDRRPLSKLFGIDDVDSIKGLSGDHHLDSIENTDDFLFTSITIHFKKIWKK